jgi:hypothetical protein
MRYQLKLLHPTQRSNIGLEGIQAAWVLSLHIHLEKEKAISAHKRSSGGLLVQNEWQKVSCFATPTF